MGLLLLIIDLALNGRVADVGLQPQLGLWSQRTSRDLVDHPVDFF